jgi:hypothetical protein
MTTKPDLHAQCVAAGIPVESHCSDLYIPVNEITRKLVAEYAAAGGTRAETFTSNIDGKRWYDVPFAYSPYWEEVAKKANR